MKRIQIAVVPTCAAALMFVASGCTALKQTDQATGALDAAMMLAMPSERNVVPVETVSSRDGAICGARAVADHGTVLVYGTVQKQWGCSGVSCATSHIEVAVIDSAGKIIETARLGFFPHEIPPTTNRCTGLSRYAVRLSKAPPRGSKIRVSFLRGAAA